MRNRIVFGRRWLKSVLWLNVVLLAVIGGWIAYRMIPAGPLVVVPYLGSPPMPDQVPRLGWRDSPTDVQSGVPAESEVLDRMDIETIDAKPWSADGLQPTTVTFDTLVVCPEQWQPTLEPWLQYRTNQGYRIGLVDSPQTPEQLKDLLRQMHPTGLRFVLLIGDVPTLLDLQGTGVPTQYVDSIVSQRFGGRPRVASDHWYADLDDDGAPELAIGRWSVHNTDQLTVLIDKTIRFENDPDIEFAKRRIEFVAGLGGFGALEDKVIESTATRMLSELIPGKFSVGMTHASWRSVYCPGPDQYCDKVFESLNRGALFWVYMGHGSWNSLDSARFPDRIVPTITTGNSQKISSSTSPIALLLACSTGQFDMRQDCLAESMLRAPHGPVSVVAGTGVTAPYGLANFGLELLTLYGEDSCIEVGAWFQQAKRRMVLAARERMQAQNQARSEETAESDPDQDASMDTASLTAMMESVGTQKIDYRQVLHQFAWLLSPTSDILEQEILEHADMMTYFGDPLLRFPKFASIELETELSGGQFGVVGHVPGAPHGPFDVEVEVGYPLDQLKFKPTSRRKYESSESFSQQLADDYVQANDRVFHRAIVSATGGRFVLPLANLGPLPNRFWVRAVASDSDTKALGYSEVDQRHAAVQAISVTTAPDESTDNHGLPVIILPDTGEQDTVKQETVKQEPKQEGSTAPGEEKQRVIDLFDGKSMSGWKQTKFGGEGEFLLEENTLVLEMGQVLSGITFTGQESLKRSDVPREDYELRIRAKRIDGNDMFCGVTFPVGDAYCSFIVGGWGGMTVGLSSVDEKDAARNETRTVHRFEINQWYDVRIKVSAERIECWIDEQQVVNQVRAGHQFSIRQDVGLSEPLGLFCFQTTAAYEKIQLVIPKE
ncbi:MAG: C25 family cysteine peptidase [Pirellulaceae bacterium]|nr:C25 family cysteine peptidase [Pirellulaceae bacterium]